MNPKWKLAAYHPNLCETLTYDVKHFDSEVEAWEKVKEWTERDDRLGRHCIYYMSEV